MEDSSLHQEWLVKLQRSISEVVERSVRTTFASSTASWRVPRNVVPTADFHAPTAVTSSPTSVLAIFTTPAATPHVPPSVATSDSSSSGDTDIVITSPITCSTICLGSDTSAALVVSTPAASQEVCVPAVDVHNSCDNAQTAVTHEINFPSAPPTSCSMDCLKGDIGATTLVSNLATSVPVLAAFEIHESTDILISPISVPYAVDFVLAPPDTCLDASNLAQVMVQPVLQSMAASTAKPAVYAITPVVCMVPKEDDVLPAEVFVSVLTASVVHDVIDINMNSLANNSLALVIIPAKLELVDMDSFTAHEVSVPLFTMSDNSEDDNAEIRPRPWPSFVLLPDRKTSRKLIVATASWCAISSPVQEILCPNVSGQHQWDTSLSDRLQLFCFVGNLTGGHQFFYGTNRFFLGL